MFRSTRRIISLLVMLCPIISGVFVYTVTPVFAASCSGTGCDGKDPDTTGCSSSAYNVETINIISSGRYIGTADLRWSPTCETNWGRAYKSSGGSETVDARVYNIDRGIGYVGFGFGGPGTTVWSPMVHAPTTRSKGCGAIGGVGWQCTSYH
jgi:hypothetical protein